MIILLLASMAIQVVCAAHVVRTGRNTAWLMVIVFFSLPGCFAYFVFEVMPGLSANRRVRAAHVAAMSKIDPERELRTAREQLALVDTADGRIRVGDALAALGRAAEAVPLYEQALALMPGTDRRTQGKLARALFDAGQPQRALAVIAAMADAGTTSDADEIAFLKARALEATGARDAALAIYQDLVRRMPGDEARCRYAALLLDIGDRDRAFDVLAEVETRAKRLDKHRRAADAEMYDWAAARLGELRAHSA